MQDPFTVKRMDPSDFYDFTDLTKQHTQRRTDSAGKSVLISKALWMNFGQAQDGSTGAAARHPNEVWIQYSFSDEPWSKVSLLKGRKKTKPSATISLPVKYPLGHPLKPKKIEDLKKMIPFLPEEYKQFYRDLAEHPQGDDSDADD